MRRGLIDMVNKVLGALKPSRRSSSTAAGDRRSTPRPPTPKPGSAKPSAPRPSKPSTSKPSTSKPGTSKPTSGARTAPGALVFEYSPCLDGDPDPGEVVWTWVTYEEDASQGKDRPVVIIGRRGTSLIGVALTSKRHDRDPQFEVGTGPWDREGRPSYAKLDRLLEIRPDAMRREGAVLDRKRFDGLVSALKQANGDHRR